MGRPRQAAHCETQMEQHIARVQAEAMLERKRLAARVTELEGDLRTTLSVIRDLDAVIRAVAERARTENDHAAIDVLWGAMCDLDFSPGPRPDYARGEAA